MSLYLLLETYPWSKTVIAVTVFISFVFFVTSADSGTVVLSTLSAKGGDADEDGPNWLRVFWGAMTALITSSLLFAGSIDSLKSAVVLTSLPFSLILLCMMWGCTKRSTRVPAADRADALARTVRRFAPWPGWLAPAPEPGGALPVTR